MAKRTPVIKISSYGIYSHWDEKSKELPKVREFTQVIPASEDVEFGFTVNIKKAKGQLLKFSIQHPGVLNKKGQVLEPFDGEVYVRSNDWNFYLGDTIQLQCPINGLESNLGTWHMEMEIAGKVIAEKDFKVVANDADQFWKKRGF
ncbi:DUF3859 domain-containing protein [Vibrio palustris]|uniref:DUF3859 domain-containing protein n=1 Tax=Vibrio palustris TaxID=1918946 RepID=A0A1R4B4T6_9VIBR|nr:DUF3859 domain-containing protein [Vibrio palustris]SJL83938.1 hypothetical protein VPAL9027_01917 [Vibrio palustris]